MPPAAAVPLDALERGGALTAGGPTDVSVRHKLCNESACRVYDSTLPRAAYLDDSHFDLVGIAENAGFFAPFAVLK